MTVVETGATRPIICSDVEWAARLKLAATYRVFFMLGWHELIFNHITLRVPGTDDQLLINPFGLAYDEVTASNLVKIDLTGKVLSESQYPVNPAGLTIHSAVHANVPDAHCVMHTHTTAGLSVACMEDGCRTRISAPPSCATWSLIIRSRALRSATKRSRGC